ncbi:MAG: DUF29 family protein [Gloeocapsa sp. DLM2.Bin57]|nr:MAG: DUF29 family protein [Gloeocapsa sp. DLM2.Bin57]
MEELLEVKELLLAGNVADALLLIDDLTEMSKDDKLNKIFSFGKVLLLHLLKQKVEKRTTRSWDLSIANAVKEIQRTNKRRKTGGTYLTEEELKETLEDAYDLALKATAKEAFEGEYTGQEIAKMVSKDVIIGEAVALILSK